MSESTMIQLPFTQFSMEMRSGKIIEIDEGSISNIRHTVFNDHRCNGTYLATPWVLHRIKVRHFSLTGDRQSIVFKLPCDIISEGAVRSSIAVGAMNYRGLQAAVACVYFN